MSGRGYENGKYFEINRRGKLHEEDAEGYVSKRREELRKAMQEKYPKTKESMSKIGSTGRKESDEEYWSGKDHS